MRYLFPLILIAGLLGVTFLGSVLFDMQANHSGGCIAPLIGGAECPKNLAEFAVHHVLALQKLKNTFVAPLSSWLAVFLFAFVFAFLFYKNLIYQRIEFLLEYFRRWKIYFFHSQQKIISWFSLFELSPAF
ncbi:hypothetical protein A2Z53_02410 [Candidatus Giovannonibacteria bacterium RIFCSPHIGHO2_02_42_15]|uniref:Uncharacterized protein n=2 Tax=Candidatus Giovannoniibacteriota TaxID=1752738 RepID=A0A1F5VPG8_9BACT|nr:MAG: hypothetical protein UV11_C0006G0012 [Candidatus Giovannonibacteria bacterium GW2011_GWF2_42_19]OGF65342.1 MAG: hypothetical protein A2Z53_02410 [Candidatus Giovannonibacteria bacterium RIFCSPHIGHO2_02_42_15]